MKIKIIIVIIFIVGFFCSKNESLKNDVQSDMKKLIIPNSFEKANIVMYNVDQIYSSISGFELDREGGDIGHVNKICIYKNILLVFDSKFAKKIFAYDLKNNGKFLFHLGNVGKGPGEFLRISDFAIDSIENQILVTDMQQKKISCFDFDGNFKTENKVNFTPLNIFCYKQHLYFICNPLKDNERVVKVIDKSFKLVKEYFPNDLYPLTVKNATSFFYIENKLLLNYPNCDTIFQFENLNLKPYIVLETGQYSFYSFIKRNNLKSKDVLTYLMPGNNGNEDFKNVIIPQIYFEDNKIRTFSFLRNNSLRLIFQIKDLNNNEPLLGFLNDNITGFPINMKLYDNHFGSISVVNSSQIVKADLNLIEKNRTKVNISSQLIQEIRNTDMDCNPFIIFYK